MLLILLLYSDGIKVLVVLGHEHCPWIASGPTSILFAKGRRIALDNIIKTRRWIFVPMVGFSSLANDGRSVRLEVCIILFT